MPPATKPFEYSSALYKVFDKHFVIEDNKSEYSKKNINKSRKVLWLFFDGLDPEYINLEVDEIKIFKNFNDLNDNGIFHSNMFPPSNWTLYSSPSQLINVLGIWLPVIMIWLFFDDMKLTELQT